MPLPKFTIRLGANLQERRRILIPILEAVYVVHKEDNAVMAIQPKPAFRAVFQGNYKGRLRRGFNKRASWAQKALNPCSRWRRGGMKPSAPPNPFWTASQLGQSRLSILRV